MNKEASKKRIQIICLLCNSNHWLLQCVNFKAKSLDESPKFVHSKDLCINCLVHGHAVSSCPKESFCRVTGCKEIHSSYLHPCDAPAVTGRDSEPAVTNLSSQPSNQALNGYVKGKGDSRCGENDGKLASSAGLALLPLKVKAPGLDKIVETYAFLDNGSNTSFCSEGLIEELGINGRETALSLTTMESKNTSIKCLAVDPDI